VGWGGLRVRTGHGGADVAEEFAARAQTRRGVVYNPPAFTVLSLQTIFEPEGLALFVSGHESIIYTLPVIGMRRVQPAEAESGFGRPPREFVPTPAQVSTSSILLGEPDHDRRVVSHLTETLLAL